MSEQLQAAEVYLHAHRNRLPATVSYEYKETYNYLLRRIFDEKTYSVVGLFIYWLRHRKLPA